MSSKKKASTKKPRSIEALKAIIERKGGKHKKRNKEKDNCKPYDHE